MEKLRGRSASVGIVFGRICFYRREDQEIKKRKVVNPELELQRYHYAKEVADKELGELYEREIDKLGIEHADIFMIHRTLLDDERFVQDIEDMIINESYSADYAVHYAANKIASDLGKIEDEYIRARTADVKDVSRRLIRLIQNASEQEMDFKSDTILCSFDLEPSEAIRLDKKKVKAVCTCYGSSTSHSSIIARTLNIPAVVGLGRALTEEYDGREVIVDGYAGIIYIDPDAPTRRRMVEKREEEGRKRELLMRLKGRRNITLDGSEIELYANISGLIDMKYVTDNDAGGIGLLRSEFLYLQNDNFPDEELQFYTYRRVLELMQGKRVIVRTFDMGPDKNPDYEDEKEINPAMGMRSIRLCFEQPEILHSQLRALYRASVYGKLAILFPMIVDPEEIQLVKQMINLVWSELDREGIAYNRDTEIGVMIETPAAVMFSDELAREVDFFNVGTNDLEQYALAVDRQESRLEKYCRPHHMAVLRMIKIAADSAHKYGKWIGICGELAANPDLTETFLAMKIDMLSVSPVILLQLRRKIRSLSIADKEEILIKSGVVRDYERNKYKLFG